ncbi:hypothetical protein CO652_08730 [Rhizobium sp. H4]|nr:hypothetical protein CO652_08730 [Rhizobium sp. H4]
MSLISETVVLIQRRDWLTMVAAAAKRLDCVARWNGSQVRRPRMTEERGVSVMVARNASCISPSRVRWQAPRGVPALGASSFDQSASIFRAFGDKHQKRSAVLRPVPHLGDALFADLH